jgi:hypothetical protein
MQLMKKLVGFYILGIGVSLVFVGFIHLYNLLFENYFSYAECGNILLTASISGIPFGIAIWIFKYLKSTK